MITVSAYMCVAACHAMYLILQCHRRLVHAFVLVYTSLCCTCRQLRWFKVKVTIDTLLTQTASLLSWSVCV